MVWSEIMLFGMRGLRLSFPVDCVFLGQMFQRGGGVQPAARPSFKCFFFLAVATSIPPRMFDVGRRQIAARRLRVVFSRPDQKQAVSK